MRTDLLCYLRCIRKLLKSCSLLNVMRSLHVESDI